MKKVLFTLIGLALLGLLIFLSIPKEVIKNKLVAIALEQIESNTDFHLEIEGASFHYPFTLKAKSVRVFFKGNPSPLVSAELLSLSLNPFDLLAAKLSISRFECAHLFIQDLPEKQSGEKTGAFKISYFSISSLQISPALLEKIPFKEHLKQEIFIAGIPVSGYFKSSTDHLKLELNIGSKPASCIFLNSSNESFSATLFESTDGIFHKPSFLEKTALQLAIRANLFENTWKGNFESSLKHFPAYVQGDFSYSLEHFIQLSKIYGNIYSTSFSGQANLSPTLILQNTLLKLITEEKQFGDPIEALLNLSGPLTSPEIEGSLSSNLLKYQEWELAQPKVTFKVYPRNPNQTGWIRFSTSVYDGSAEIVIDKDQLHLSHFSAHSTSTQFDGGFTIGFLPSFEITGRLKGSNILLEDWLPQLRGVGTLQAYFQRNTVQADFWVDNGHFQDLFFTHTHGYFDLTEKGDAKLRVQFQEGIWGDIEFQQGLFTTEMPTLTAFSPFTFALSGDLKKPFNLESKGMWQLSQENFSIDLLQGEAFGYPFSLKDPLKVHWDQTHFEFSPLFLEMGPGWLYAVTDYSPTFVQSTLRVQKIPLTIAHLFYPEFPLEGFASGHIFLFGPPASPRGQMQLDFANVKLDEEAFMHFPPLQFGWKASLADSILDCQGEIIGIEKNPLRANAKIPLSLSLLPFELKLHRDQPLHVQLKGQGPLSPILSLFVVDKTSVEGDVEMQLGVEGSLNDPKVNGFVTLKNGVFESLTSGATLRAIQAKIVGKENQIVLEQFTAQDPSNGSITGQGKLLLDRSRKFPFEAQFDLHRLHLFQTDFIQTSATGKLSLRGNQTEGLLSGKLVSNKTQMTIPNQIAGSIQTVEVTYVNQPEHEVSPSLFPEKKSAWPLKLNVELQLPSRSTLKATGLTSEWRGNLLLTGTMDTPELEGTLKATQGEYLLNGKKFLLKEGSAVFAGDPLADSSLYVVGGLDLGKIVVELIVKGAIKDPIVSLISNPPLSQQEILSWLLFGKGFSEISPYQGDQLTASLAELSQGSSRPDLLTKIRNQIGIDRIDINRNGEGDSGDVSLEVGKYITQGTYLSVSKNMGNESNEVNIETSIFKNIKLQAGVSDDGNGHFDIIWKHDY